MKKQGYIAAAHRKLKGKWQSDGKKTMSRWVFPKRIAGARLKLWKGIFGKNEWRFTATRVYGDFEGRKSISSSSTFDGWVAKACHSVHRLKVSYWPTPC